MFCAISVFAQLPTGTILGVIRDPTGALLPGASLTVRNAGTGVTRTVVTDETGAYRVPALAVGRYDITAELPGFKTSVQRGVELEVTQEAVVNLTLEVGTTSQRVEVVAEAAQVETTTSSLGGLVNESKISQLPLNGRNFIDLSLMQTGVSWQPQTSSSPPAGTGGTKFSSNGAPTTSNYYMLDGASIANIFGQSPTSIAGTTLGLGGIKEYKVITNTFSAEYGMTMGSQMVIVSKGGSNEFHGELFEYLRNSAMDARNFFDTTISSGGRRLPQFQRNNFGGAFGGPIKKDKTFFWGVFEGLQQRNGVTSVSNDLGAGCHGTLGTVVWNGLDTRPAGSAGPCPQLGPNPAGPNTNAVVIGSASPAVVPLVNAYPLPTDSTNPLNPTYSFSFTSPTSEKYFQMRIDHNFSEKNTFFGRYTIDDATQTNPRPFNLWKDDDWATRNQSMTLSETHIVSPTLLNTVRLSGSRQGLFTYATPAAAISGSQFVFIPRRLPGTISITGLTNIGGDTCSPSKEPQDVITASDDIFYTRGRHSFKLGTLINYYQQHILLSCGTSGTLAFASVANLLRGIPRSLSARTQNSEENGFFTFKTYGFYIQDDVRAAPRLTLNLGLRYEFRTDPVARDSRSSALRNLLTDKDPTIGPPTKNPSLSNIGPRLGLAWDVRGNGKMSVRSGFAVLYDLAQFGLALANTVSGAPPFVTQFTISNPGSFTVPWPAAAANTANALFSEWNGKQSKMLQYNLSIQQQLPFSTLLTVAYTGSRGQNLPTKWDQNFPQAPIHGVVTNGIGCDGAAAPGHLPNGWPCLAPVVATCAQIIPSCRPNPNWGTLAILANRSKLWYDSLQIELNKRFSRGLQFQSAYTLSKGFDLSQGSTGDATDFNHLDEALPYFSMKGRTQYDARHIWRFNTLYRIPSLRSQNVAAKALDGWWIGTIVALQTGYPFTPTIGGNRSTYGAAIGASATGTDRPDLVTTPATLNVAGATNNFVPYDPQKVITGNPKQWFNPFMFMVPRMGYFGTAPRNFLDGPGLSNVDFSLNKDTRVKRLGEQGQIQFRAEVFNLFNHPNFATPNTTVFAGNGPAAGGVVEAPLANAGQILSTRTRSRQIQLALKMLF
jgi:outer membrane receptor protein involved in Fe transport